MNKTRGDPFFINNDGKEDINIDILTDCFHKLRKIPKKIVIKIVRKAKSVLNEEKNVLRVESPIFIIGDIHGQFFDLENILNKFPKLPKSKFLFLGDYVDRGNFNLETILYILALKVKYTDRIFMIRGNHETRKMTMKYGFYQEIYNKYLVKKEYTEIYDEIMQCFDTLPIAAVMDNNFFCIHGGIAPELKNIAQLEEINRRQEPLTSTLQHSILWSDPCILFDENEENEFTPNDERNCSYYYTYNNVCNFLSENKLSGIIRAHSCYKKGYHLFKNYKNYSNPSVLSVFSAPNYIPVELDSEDVSKVERSKGAVLYVNKDKKIKIFQFDGVEEPFVLQDSKSILEVMIPSFASQATEIYLKMFSTAASETQKKMSNETTGAIKAISDIYKEVEAESNKSITYKREIEHYQP